MDALVTHRQPLGLAIMAIAPSSGNHLQYSRHNSSPEPPDCSRARNATTMEDRD
ncbi:hypothetical protein LR48_Vigan11g121700 [Vigna angularis]|uniref:Uncharacterized protein n=1 Tax=Phaseolus angularis TaxID=3914 RepID=A0A0L9UEN4_PHAAN|nr:hypothetical protein LR48_Vigan04g137900 [Vigna angularis]KOM58183.1 hypothetical protein LR48_Vigan11g121700 [Vigna angularis]